MPQVNEIFESLSELVAQIQREKSAAPAGVGETSHPSEKVDPGTQAASEGARGAENTADVKKEVPGPSIDATPEATPGDANAAADNQPQMGPRKSSVGGDPAVEDDYDEHQQDPGTEHPAKADRGEKYSSWSFNRLADQATKTANSILAELAQKPAPKKAAVSTAAADPVTKAAYDGYAAAAMFGSADPKVRAEVTIAATIKEAKENAWKTVEYLTRFHDELRKAAGEEGVEPAPEEEAMPEPPPGGGGGGAPPAELAAMLGGAPPAGGAPPMPGGGEMPPPGGGGAPAADPGHGEILQELASAMIEMGIPIEELAQAMEQSQGGAPGGAPPPPAEAKQAAAGRKLVSDLKAYRRSGQFTFKEAKGKRAEDLRRQMRGYLAELVADR